MLQKKIYINLHIIDWCERFQIAGKTKIKLLSKIEKLYKKILVKI